MRGSSTVKAVPREDTLTNPEDAGKGTEKKQTGTGNEKKKNRGLTRGRKPEKDGVQV